MSLRASNRRLSNLGSEQWLKEEEDDAAKEVIRVGRELTQAASSKESLMVGGNLADFS